MALIKKATTACLLLTVAVQASAAVLSFREGDGGLYSETQATTLYSEDPTKNFGLEAEVIISGPAPDTPDVIDGVRNVSMTLRHLALRISEQCRCGDRGVGGLRGQVAR